MHNFHLWLLTSKSFVYKILIVYVPEHEEQVEEKLLQSTHYTGCMLYAHEHITHTAWTRLVELNNLKNSTSNTHGAQENKPP